MTTTTRLLSAEDIYDVYGLEELLSAPLEASDLTQVTQRLHEIKDAYVHACKSRIRAEARFLGLDVEDISFAAMLGRIKDHLGKAIQKSMMANAERMQRGGSFNLMAEILKAHQAAGSMPEGVDPAKYGVKVAPPVPRPDVDPDWFKKGTSGRVTEDPKWAEITKAYLAVDKAITNREIVSAIDTLNQLQHNSFHVLIDLQTGRMLNDFSNATDHNAARARLQEILNIKQNATDVATFAGKMSGDVRKLLTKYRIDT